MIAPHHFAKHVKNRRFTRVHAGVGFGFFVVAFLILLGMTNPAVTPPASPTVSFNPSKTASSAHVATVPSSSTNTVTAQQITETKPIAFSTTTQSSASLPKGQTRVLQAGQNGVETRVYTVTYTDGQQTAQTLTSDTVTTKPVNEIIAAGTYVAPVASPAPVSQPAPVPAPVPAASPLAVAFTCASATDYAQGQICVHTKPNAALTVSVTYCSGYDATSNSLQGTSYADANGTYTWTWEPETKCKGAATATVSASWQGQSVSASDSFTVH